MKYPINYTNISINTEYYSEVDALCKEAETYLLDFKWCRTIKNSFLYTNIGYVLCIFLFEIDNTQSKDDNFLWVIVGDLPAMYLDVYGAKTTKEALEGYVELAEDWINNIKTGQSVNDCYPFKAEPTLEMAELLERRTLFIRNQLLNNVDDISVVI
jgi:hypothetical protein